MSIIKETADNIHNYGDVEAVFAKIAENWGCLFEAKNIEGAEHYYIYLDTSKNIFLDFFDIKNTTADSFIQFALTLYHDNIPTVITNASSQTTTNDFYTDSNPTRSVLYLRIKYSTNYPIALICAKESNGDWVCFLGNKYMYTKNGKFDYGNLYITVDKNLLYTAYQMPNAQSGAMLDSLYKMYTSPSFVRDAGLYVVFEDKPYRVVPIDNGSANYDNPAFAFEARQE